MANEPMYDEWLADRRAVKPSPDLTNRVMKAVEEQSVQHKHSTRFVDRMNNSRPIRWAACLAALLVGCLPFGFVFAFLTESIVF